MDVKVLCDLDRWLHDIWPLVNISTVNPDFPVPAT